MKSTQLRRVAKQPLEQQATESLRDFILSGSLQPGARLTETALADQMGVGRGSLRTGLQRLADEGIVVQIPYTGWQVAELTAKDAWELWTLRGSLEGMAAKLAAQSSDPAVREQIKGAYDNLVDACSKGNLKKISECDFGLHRTIIQSVGHSRLERQYKLVEQQVRLYIMASNSLVTEGPEAIVKQHRPMMKALLDKDGERAAHEAWVHNETEGRVLAEWLRKCAES